MMNRCGGCLAISPLISTQDHNTTARRVIIALKMNYTANIRGIQFSFKSIFQSFLSVKGTWQTVLNISSPFAFLKPNSFKLIWTINK